MHNRIRLSALFLAVLAAISILPVQTAYAAASTIYLSPSSSTMAVGASFTVQVRATSDNYGYAVPGQAIGQVRFPASSLTVTSLSTSGSVFPNMSASPNNSSGTVDFFGSNNPSPAGNFYLFSITFKTLRAGTAAVSFSSGTSVNQSAYFNPTTIHSGGSYTINSPPAPTPAPTPPPPAPSPSPSPNPSPAPSPSPNPSPAPSPSPNPSPAPSPTAVDQALADLEASMTAIAPIEQEAAKELPEASPQDSKDDAKILRAIRITRRYTDVILTWSHTTKATTTISYGTSQRTMTRTAKPSVHDDGSYKAQLTGLEPGKTYYFKLTATGEDKKTDEYTGVFTTRGYPIVIVATDGSTVLTGAEVMIGKQTFKTDKKGTLTVELPAGTHEVVLKSGDTTRKTSIDVKKSAIPASNTPPATQEFRLDLRGTVEQPGSGSLLPLILIGGVSLVGLAAGAVAFLLWRRRHLENTSPAEADQDYRTLLAAYQVPIESKHAPAPALALASEPAPAPYAPATPSAPIPIPSLPPAPAPVIATTPGAPIAESYAPPLTSPTPPAVDPLAIDPTPPAPSYLTTTVAPVAPPATILSTPPAPAAPHNSVYIDDEEPLDMFETSQINLPHARQ